MDVMVIANLLFAILRAGCFLAGFYVAKGVLFDSGLRFDVVFKDPASRPGRVAKAFFWLCLGYLFAAALFAIVNTLQNITWILWYMVFHVAEARTEALATWLLEASASLGTMVLILVVTYGLAALAFKPLDWDSIAERTGWAATTVEKVLVLLTMGNLLFAPAQLVVSTWNRVLLFVAPGSALGTALTVGQNAAWLGTAIATIVFLFLYKPRGKSFQKDAESVERRRAGRGKRWSSTITGIPMRTRRRYGETPRAAIPGPVPRPGRAGLLRRRERRLQRGHGGVDRGGVQHPAAGGDRPATPPGQP
jgi:hypothetical protein